MIAEAATYMSTYRKTQTCTLKYGERERERELKLENFRIVV